MTPPSMRWRGPLLLGFLGGCAVFRQLAGKNTVDLEKVEVKSMGVDIRKVQKTICPREKVQMAVFAEIVDGSEKQSVETWQGASGTNRNGKLDFADFVFESGEG